MSTLAHSTILKIEGPPGSGKTRALAREACRLIVEEGISAEKILILTVTPPIRKRLRQFLKKESALAGIPEAAVEVLTWENFMVTVLQGPNPSEESEVSLLPEPDARVLLHRILCETIPADHPLYHASRQLSFSRVLFEFIRQLQLHQISPEALSLIAAQSQDADHRLPLLAEIYHRFLVQTANRGLLCHADLMHRASRFVRESADIRQWLGEKYPVIMVDDAQELSEAQHHLLAALPVRLILSGDERFSVRHFRGAQPKAFASLSPYNERPVTLLPQLSCMRGNEAVLSLLNTFLPQPVWEVQAPDTVSLESTVQFAFYADPEAESDGLARLLQTITRTQQVDEGPARWEDCVILLRTGHYKPQLMNALIQAGIPFRTEIFTDNLIRFQHLFYDLLCVLDDFRRLNVQATRLQDGGHIRACLDGLSMPLVEKLAWLHKANRHLRRYLEASITDEDAAKSLNLLRVNDPADPETVDLLLALLAEAGRHSPLSPALALLAGYYQDLQAQLNYLNLLEQLMERFLLTLPGEELKEVQDGLTGFRLNLERLDAHYRATFEQTLPIDVLLNIYHTLWDGTEAASPTDTQSGGRVTIRSLHQMQGLEAPFVFIPFLVSEEFPLTRETPALLSETDEALLGVELAYRTDEAEEARLLAVGMSRATHQLVLSCHRSDGGAPVLPSVFYKTLLDGKRVLLGQEQPARICWCETDDVTLARPCEMDTCTRKQAITARDNDFYSRYTRQSAWAALSKETANPLFGPQETIYLSASSIKTYMTCPRQFYYKHLLRLPQPGSEAATLGSLVHRLMEVFNRQTSDGQYTAQHLHALAESMFRFEEAPDAFFRAGFQEDDLRVLRRLSQLTLANLRQRLLEAVTDLERKGYFARYGTRKTVEAEKALESFALPGIERCRFSGIMDALIQLEDGHWEIVDYKTFQSAYSTGLDTCDKHFRGTLEPLPDGDDLEHGERFAGKLSISYPKDYQLPLYYLACNGNPAYQGRLRGVVLQIIRPPLPGNESQGAIRLALSGSEIEACQEHMLADINRYIVEPILDSAVFETNPNRTSCGSCGYFGICDAGADADETGGEV